MGEYELLKSENAGGLTETVAVGDRPESTGGLTETVAVGDRPESTGSLTQTAESEDRSGNTDGLAQRDRQLEKRRQQASEKLQDAIGRELAGESPETAKAETLLWNALILYQDVPFVTSKNLQFTYSIRGYEMFVSRKDKSITRSTVNLAFGMAMKLLREDVPVSGPKKLGTFGASYLYPIFIHIGVIPVEKTKKRKRQKMKEQD